MRKAIVAGATGVTGGYLMQHLISSDEWEVIGISRRKPDLDGRYDHVALDLLNASECRAKLASIDDVTHVFFGAYIDKPSPVELTDVNLAMLRNLVETVENGSQLLEHIHLVEGTKWYGSHLGPFRTPARESDPRIVAQPFFYYAQQDWLEAAQKGKQWTWSAIRPHTISGFSLGSAMNLTMVLAVYATICKELGLPFTHPGTPTNYHILYQAVDAGLLARAIEWMSTTAQCANQAFNVTNGDLFRWEYLWPRMAEYFELDVGPQRHFSLQEFMADKAPVWDRIVAKHGLRPNRFEDLAGWKFGDFVFSSEWDVISDCGKARRAGFCETVDTEEMFLRLFTTLRKQSIIP
jgi:nucleoside-diphosphate-sugar epimerase